VGHGGILPKVAYSVNTTAKIHISGNLKELWNKESIRREISGHQFGCTDVEFLPNNKNRFLENLLWPINAEVPAHL